MKYEIGKKWEESSYGWEYLRGKTVVYRATRNYLRTAGNALHGQSNLIPESGGAKPPFTKTTSSWRHVGKWNLTLCTCVLGNRCQRSASCLCHFTSEEKAPGNHRMGNQLRPHKWSRRFREYMDFLLLSGIEPCFLSLPSRSLVAKPTGLSCILPHAYLLTTGHISRIGSESENLCMIREQIKFGCVNHNISNLEVKEVNFRTSPCDAMSEVEVRCKFVMCFWNEAK